MDSTASLILHRQFPHSSFPSHRIIWFKMELISHSSTHRIRTDGTPLQHESLSIFTMALNLINLPCVSSPNHQNRGMEHHQKPLSWSTGPRTLPLGADRSPPVCSTSSLYLSTEMSCMRGDPPKNGIIFWRAGPL